MLEGIATPALTIVCDYLAHNLVVGTCNTSASQLLSHSGPLLAGTPIQMVIPDLVAALVEGRLEKCIDLSTLLERAGTGQFQVDLHAVRLLPSTLNHTEWLCTLDRSTVSQPGRRRELDSSRLPSKIGPVHHADNPDVGQGAVLVSTVPSKMGEPAAIVFANEPFYNMTGLTASDVLGNSIGSSTGLFVDNETLNRAVLDAADGATVRYSVTVATKLSGDVVVEAELLPIFDASRSVSHLMHVFHIDSKPTDGIPLAPGLSRKLEAVVNKALDGYALLDVHGAILDASSSGLIGLGWPREYLLGRNCLDIVHPEDQEFVVNVFRDIRSMPGATRRIDMRVNKADGAITWIAVTFTNLLHEPDVRAIVLNYSDVTTRKYTEFALQRSEERHRLLFESNPGAMWLCNPESLKVMQVNTAAELTYGYSSREFAAMTILDMLPLTSRQAFLTKCHNAPIDQPTSLGVWSLIVADGSVVDAEFHASRLVEENSDLILIMAVDVTMQTLAHRELLNSNLRVQLLLEEEQERSEILHALAEAAILINTCKTSQDVLQRAADYARRLTHAVVATIELDITDDQEAAVSVTSTDLPSESVTQTIASAVEASLTIRKSTSGSMADFDLIQTEDRDASRHVDDRDGTVTKLTVPLRDVGGRVVGCLEVYREGSSACSADDENVLVQLAQMVTGTLNNRRLVEELTRNSEELRKSEERYALALEGSNDGIWDWLVDSDVVIRSPRFLSLVGFDSNENIEHLGAWNERIHPEDREKVAKARHDHLYHGVPYDVEMRVLTFSGEYRSFRSRGQAVWDESGRPVRMVGSFTDLTERKALEEQLLQAQKLESIGRLAGGIAHDFNNMLTGILGFGELARLKLDEGSTDIQEDLQQIEGAALRAAELTSQLLAFARKQIITPQTTDLNELARTTHSMLTRLIGETIFLQEDLQEDLWMVNIDPGQFQQVIMNLAVNARDAMPNGGRLLIETANVVLDSEYAALHAGLVPGEYVMLAVTDTGIGMDDTTKSLIFEPFFTTKERGKGTGLGLATVYGIISQNQGHVHVYSEPGRGTAFKCYFRRVYDDTVVYEPPTEPSAPMVGTERVLLVEDDSLVRQFAEAALVSGGYSVVAVGNGPDALGAALHQERPFDLVVTDVVLPGMGGNDLAERLADYLPGIKVLFVSGYTENAVVHQGVLSPGTSFLSKPFTVSSLLTKVRSLLDL